jgi:ABC-2 type transport system ATP-binding protein
MKQRLGLAAALVHDPHLLILDEPTNGLDPAGMLEMRQLIRYLVEQEGKTIMLSSHLLHEVEQVCDRVLILSQGQTIVCGRVDELLEQGGHIELHVAQAEQAVVVLRSLDWVSSVQLRDGIIFVDAPTERAAELTAALAAQGLYLHGLQVAERSLEAYFLAVTGNDQQAGAPA